MIGNPNVIGSLILKIAGAKATLVIFLFCFSFEKNNIDYTGAKANVPAAIVE